MCFRSNCAGRNGVALSGVFVRQMSLVLYIFLIGCGDRVQTPLKKLNLQPQSIFDSPSHISAWRSIQNGDRESVRNLLKAGLDPNLPGTDNMTLLFWALVCKQTEIFSDLLNAGANPNICLTGNFGFFVWTVGESITFTAFGAEDIRFSQLVVAHGADLTLLNPVTGESLLHRAIRSATTTQEERVQLLIERRAALDCISRGLTPAMSAAGRGRFRIVKLLLEAGANPFIYPERGHKRLVHRIASHELGHVGPSAEQKAEIAELEELLEELGESLDDARNDLFRWSNKRRDGSIGMFDVYVESEKKRRIAEDPRYFIGLPCR